MHARCSRLKGDGPVLILFFKVEEEEEEEEIYIFIFFFFPSSIPLRPYHQLRRATTLSCSFTFFREPHIISTWMTFVQLHTHSHTRHRLSFK